MPSFSGLGVERGSAGGCALAPAVPTLELLDATARVHQLLLAGVEGVALAAELDAQVGLRRAGGERVPARALDRRLDVLGVDVCLHKASQCKGSWTESS